MEKGRLYLVGTPIGNLGDMTFRAIETLKNVDLILCEDTRNSSKLLSHFEFKNNLMSYHEHNEEERVSQVRDLLESGKDIALISDAGMPGISDPGQVLVKNLQAEYRIEVVPGPSAIVAAVSLSGFSYERFQFLGFLPRKSTEKQEILESTLNYPGISVIYESPKRLINTLKIIEEISPNREVFIGRELTKLYEESYRAEVEEAIDYFSKGLKGEIVLILNEYHIEEEIDIEEKLRSYIQSGISSSKAVKILAKEYGLSKNELYKISLNLKND